MIAYPLKYYRHLFEALIGHMELLLLTLFLGSIASVALAFLIYRYRFMRAPVLVVMQMLYTVPSLAAFAVLIPFSGLGVKTAVIALVCYSLFFIVRHFLEGMDGIDPQIREAGRAMGYSPFRLFLHVELPLAAPAILAGIRTASVSTIGIACIAYAVGAGGIGAILFEGMMQLSYVKIAWGSILAVLLSVVTNSVLLAVERKLTEMANPGRIAGQTDSNHERKRSP